MEKLEYINRDDFSLGGYNSHFNQMPSEDCEEISEDQYFSLFFLHFWEFADSKQVIQKNEPLMKMRLFLKESFSGKAVGIYIADKDGVRSFGKFGDWDAFTASFAAQFAGDNS